MGRLTVYRDNYADTTLVSNLFIDEYMKDANDAQLKVYLYLLRIMTSNLSTSVSDMADLFNHTEKDVLRALHYWEQQKLLNLEYDPMGNVSGIHLETPCRKGNKDSMPMSPVVSLVAKIPPLQPPAGAEPRQPFDVQRFEKPVYTLDELKAFQAQESTAQLLFITEQYLQKPLSPSDIKTILFFSDILHFSDDLIDYLIQYCVERGKKDFRYIEKVALSWAENGVATPAQAEKYVHKYDRTVYSIMNALGKSNAPTAREVDYINRWTKEFGFEPDIIFEACERTVLATENHRFEYADKILTSWQASNVRHKSDIQKVDELYQKKKNAAVYNHPSSSNRFNQFKQHDYDFDAIERAILSK